MAAATDDVPLRRDAIAFLHVRHESADLRDVSGELVSDGERRVAPSLCPCVPLVDVYVGAADSGASHSDQDFVVANAGLRYILEDKTGTRRRFHQRFHARVAPQWFGASIHVLRARHET